jgi:NADH-quinone oxidoreductase subunit A
VSPARRAGRPLDCRRDGGATFATAAAGNSPALKLGAAGGILWLDSSSASETHTHFMPQNYVPIFIFMAVIGVLLPVTLLAAKLVRPDNPSKTKLMPYECGIDPIDSARGRYTVRYYIVAILFVVFDVETIFLFPWAVKFKALGLFGLGEMLIFLVILISGYIWVWKKGALEWV